MAMLSQRQVLRFLVPRFATCVSRTTISTIPRNLTRIHSLTHSRKRFCSSVCRDQKETVMVYFIQEDGSKLPGKARVGDNLLDVVVENDLDIDGFGACEGTLACSTCHLIFKKKDYDNLPEAPTDEELDMLDLAYGLTEESRLGCQVIVTKDMEGLEVRVPQGIADAREPS
ncbi:hypothetical protein ScPMuIL_012074 [Solemya velum]